MILNKFFVIAFATLIASQAYSAQELTQMQKKAAMFFLSKKPATEKKGHLLTLSQWSADACKPNNSLNQECVKFAQPTWPTQEDKLKVVRACKGDIDMKCANLVIPTWPTFDDKLAAIEACRNNVNMECVNLIMPTWPTQQDKLDAAITCGE
jgi:hypothetical protein